ncbi:MAG TPA: radical SAM family heme chaperone HemW [Candidatus Marinimicrobia bacterium]|nr:radical SAM family heme chaperone HemW [Candidatus Neomarinimicrobiota bacterium]
MYHKVNSSVIRAGIYIHVPFCTVRCMYCDFYTITYEKNSIPQFLNAIVSEIERCELDTLNWIIDTLFIGGGTPSLLDSKSIEVILKVLQKNYDLSNIQEFTIEINPGESSLHQLRNFRGLGINRISIGVQSLEPELLKFLTRNHSIDDIYKTYNHARIAGFDNINFDLLYNIPGQTIEQWKRNLERIIMLDPAHISAYALIVEKGTELHQLVHDGKVSIPGDPDGTTWLSFTTKYLSDHGFSPYEISSFTQPGQECRHNLHYWRMEPCLAFGPSAHGFDGHRRWKNVSSMQDYLDKIKNGESPVVFTEELNYKNILNEKVGFGIRMTEGVDLKKIQQPELSMLKLNLEKSEKMWPGCIVKNNEHLKLSEKGILFADSIAVDLMIG